MINVLQTRHVYYDFINKASTIVPWNFIAGSMPPHSQFLWQEGMCVKSYKLVSGGKFQEEGTYYVNWHFCIDRKFSDEISFGGDVQPDL